MRSKLFFEMHRYSYNLYTQSNMKTYFLIFNLFLAVTTFAQNNDSQYRADHGGKELSNQEIQKLFEKEEELHQSDSDLEGKISIIPNSQFEKIFDNKLNSSNLIVVSSLLGKRYYNEKEAVDKLSSQDFKRYYDSLNEKNKRAILTSYNFNQKNKGVFEDRDLQRFLLSEFDRIKKVKNKGNIVQIHKIDFIQNFEFPGALDSTISFLTNAVITDYSALNDEFILFVFEKNETAAFQAYERIIDEYLLFKKENPEDEEVFINLDIKKVFLSFLNSKNSSIQNDFINHSLKTISQDVFDFRNISTLVEFLWNSEKLTDKQTDLFIQALKQLKSEDAIELLKGYKICLEGIGILDQFSETYIRDSLTLELLYPLAKFGLTEDESNKLITFIEDHQEQLKKNTACYNCSFTYIKEIINSMSILNQVNSVCHQLNPENIISLKKVLKEFFASFYHSDESPMKPYLTNLLPSFLLKEYYPLIQFDTEAGMIPLDYDILLMTFGKTMQKHLGEELHVRQVNKNYNRETDNYHEIIYSISMGTKSSKIYNVELPNSGDWYSLSSIIASLNLILQDIGSDQRWFSIDSWDQTSQYALIPLDDYKIIKPMIPARW